MVSRGTFFEWTGGSRPSSPWSTAFAKAVLTCVPEPPPDARPQATARARERYDRLIKAAGQAMSGDARTAMEDLVSHGTK